MQNYINFKHRDFANLRNILLENLNEESAAVLIGKTEKLNGYKFLNVIDTKFAKGNDYHDQSIAFLRLNKKFIYEILVEVTNRYDVDTIIDVHTHPFSIDRVGFSGTDDNDERSFFQFLDDKFDGINYASIVLSQESYSARLWAYNKKRIVSQKALIRTQTKIESIPNYDSGGSKVNDTLIQGLKKVDNFYNRGVLALGLKTMRDIMDGQTITLVGVGGLGSIIGEHLVHMGFNSLNFIDQDVLEISNLNRFVGGYYEDAKNNSYKVDVLKRHLKNINPNVKISTYRNRIQDKKVEEVIALSDWVILSTDNHYSRFETQRLCFQYFVPFISVGVNITVVDEKIEDMSGEVITIRMGDNLCLNCLRRLNPTQIAFEEHPEESIKENLVKKGYVTGKDIKEPAVKTLNTLLSTIATDLLINQYTEQQEHEPIWVYENNLTKSIYPDTESVSLRNKNCYVCSL